jgi:hypothetical protein
MCSTSREQQFGLLSMNNLVSVQTMVTVLVVLLTAADSHAQRNIFDVPTAEIVEYNVIFLQGQGVFNSEEVSTGATITFGLGYNFEVGVSVNQLVFTRSDGVNINSEKPEENPDLLVNAQKGFELGSGVRLGIGTRSGIDVAQSEQKHHFVTFDYLTSQFTLGGAHQITGGVYYADNEYAGAGTHFGAMGGVDLSFAKQKLHVLAEFLTGNSALSVINTGFQIDLPRQWQLSAGAQLSFPGGDNKPGAIFQISKN